MRTIVPKPWRMLPYRKYPSNERGYYISSDTTKTCFATISIDSDMSESVARETARLIIAAPDLLEVANATHALLNQNCLLPKDIEMIKTWLSEAIDQTGRYSKDT